MTTSKPRGSAEGRARAHATRVNRSRIALIEALEKLVAEQSDKTGTGMLVTPQQLAAKAGVSVSTLYNRFPGSLGEVASEAVSAIERRGDTPHPHLVALGAAHTAQKLSSSNAAERIAAQLKLLPSSSSDLEDGHHELLDSLHAQSTSIDLPPALKGDLWAKTAMLEVGSEEQRFGSWETALVLYKQAPDTQNQQIQCLVGMVEHSRAMREFPIGMEAWTLQRDLIAELHGLARASADPSISLWSGLDLALLNRALGLSDAAISEILLETFRLIAEVENPNRIAQRAWDALLSPAVLASQAGFLDPDAVLEIQNTAVNAIKDREDRFWPREISQLALANLTASKAIQSVDQLIDQGYIGPEGFSSTGLLWAPYNLITRRRMNLSSTRLAEKKFIEYAQRHLVLTHEETTQLANELRVDMETSVEYLSPEDDPAAAIIHELARVAKELMVTHPQSAELRQKGLAWQRLIFDELLDPI